MRCLTVDVPASPLMWKRETSRLGPSLASACIVAEAAGALAAIEDCLDLSVNISHGVHGPPSMEVCPQPVYARARRTARTW